MMYESDELFEMALMFMQKRFSETKQLVEILPNLTILDHSHIPVFEDYVCLSESLAQVVHYVRSYEVWSVHSDA